MVVDPEVDGDVVAAGVPRTVADDEECRRLASAPVTPGIVAGRERCEQAAGQRLVGIARLVGVLHRGDDEVTGQDVALDGVPGVVGTGDAARPVETRVPGVARRAAVEVDEAHLAVVASVVLLEQPLEGDRRGRALVEVGERESLVGDVRVGLRGHRPDTGHGGRYDGAHGQELGGDGDAPRLTVGGSRHDGERHGVTVSHIGLPSTPA